MSTSIFKSSRGHLHSKREGVVRLCFYICIFICLLIFLSLVVTAPAEAARLPMICTAIFDGYDKAPVTDSAVEIELPSSAEVLNLFTTPDETLKPLFKNLAMPTHIRNKLLGAFPNFSEALSIPWDLLSVEQKKLVLVAAARSYNQNFFEPGGRNIRGLKYRDSITLTFKKETRLFGKIYPPGTHRIATPDILKKWEIQFSSADSLKTGEGFEIHLRGGVRPSRLIQEAFALQQGLNLSKPRAIHIHVVAAFPGEQLATDPEWQSTRMMDHVRRTNLASVLMAIDNGHAISKRAENPDTQKIDSMTPLVFGPIEATFLSELIYYLLAYARGDFIEVKDDLKLGWVGVRFPDFFDSRTPPLWSLEFRDVDPRYDQIQLGDLLDQTQILMETNLMGNSGTPGAPPSGLRKWFELKKDRIARSASSLWYTTYAPSPTPLQRRVRQVLQPSTLNDESILMLLHDWSEDPLFIDSPEALTKLRNAQSEALQAILVGVTRSDFSPSSVMKRFIHRSGLYFRVANSLGLIRLPPK